MPLAGPPDERPTVVVIFDNIPKPQAVSSLGPGRVTRGHRNHTGRAEVSHLSLRTARPDFLAIDPGVGMTGKA